MTAEAKRIHNSSIIASDTKFDDEKDSQDQISDMYLCFHHNKEHEHNNKNMHNYSQYEYIQ